MTNLPATVPDCRYGYINFPSVGHLDLANALQRRATEADQTIRTDTTTASAHSRICIAFYYEAFPIHVSQPLMASCCNAFGLDDATDLPNAMLQRPFRPPPLSGPAQLTPVFGHWSVSTRVDSTTLFQSSSARRQITLRLAPAPARTSGVLFILLSAPAAMRAASCSTILRAGGEARASSALILPPRVTWLLLALHVRFGRGIDYVSAQVCRTSNKRGTAAAGGLLIADLCLFSPSYTVWAWP
ncbi:hypothetical protein LY76DRAFT_103232 [Colletotrichum caudatum]|nr:hypothetical protein LY76DRAFT_103232 [Colletotrichum caudatum]